MNMVLLICVTLTLLINLTLFDSELTDTNFTPYILLSIFIPSTLVFLYFLGKKYHQIRIVTSFIGLFAFSLFTFILSEFHLLLSQILFMGYLITDFVLIGFYEYYPLYPIDKMQITVYKRSVRSRRKVEFILSIVISLTCLVLLAKTKF